MAVDGWLVDRSAVARSHLDGVRAELRVLQRNLAHHHGMWHRTATADMLIAETSWGWSTSIATSTGSPRSGPLSRDAFASADRRVASGDELDGVRARLVAVAAVAQPVLEPLRLLRRGEAHCNFFRRGGVEVCRVCVLLGG